MIYDNLYIIKTLSHLKSKLFKIYIIKIKCFTIIGIFLQIKNFN